MELLEWEWGRKHFSILWNFVPLSFPYQYCLTYDAFRLSKSVKDFTVWLRKCSGKHLSRKNSTVLFCESTSRDVVRRSEWRSFGLWKRSNSLSSTNEEKWSKRWIWNQRERKEDNSVAGSHDYVISLQIWKGESVLFEKKVTETILKQSICDGCRNPH